jgi:hypothetical protein
MRPLLNIFIAFLFVASCHERNQPLFLPIFVTIYLFAGIVIGYDRLYTRVYLSDGGIEIRGRGWGDHVPKANISKVELVIPWSRYGMPFGKITLAADRGYGGVVFFDIERWPWTKLFPNAYKRSATPKQILNHISI